MVCTANGEHPSSTCPFGFSAFVFAPEAKVPKKSKVNPASYTTRGNLRDPNRRLAPCNDLVFRETGECIHVCDVRNSAFIIPNPSDREYPITARVHGIDCDTDDPRLSGTPVPSAVKWLNDELDVKESLSSAHFRKSTIASELTSSEAAVEAAYRYLDSTRIVQRLQLSTTASGDIDEWGMVEREALAHISDTLSVLNVGVPIDAGDCSLHAAFADKEVEIAAVRCQTHLECCRHLEKAAVVTHSGVLLIIRDKDNTPLTPEEIRKFYDGEAPKGLATLDFQTLFQWAKKAENKDEFCELVNEIADASQSKFV